jgi:hypothetical protein
VPEITYDNFAGGVNDTDRPGQVGPAQLSDGANISFDDRGGVKERAGSAQYASTISGSTAVLGLHAYEKYSTGVIYPLCVYATDIYYNNAGTWTAQSQSLTTGKVADFVDAFDVVYFVNGTDNVRYWNGSSWTADATIPKGTMIEFHENRLLIAGVSGNEEKLYFSSLGTDTFPSTSYVSVEKPITAILAGDLYFYIFTKNQMYRFAKFTTIDGYVTGPDKLEKLPAQVGAVNNRVVKRMGSCIMTLDYNGVWRTNGFDRILLTADAKGTWDGLDQDYFVDAAAAVYDNKYYLSVRTSGASNQDKILVFDSTKVHQTATGELVWAYAPYTGLTASVMGVIPSANFVESLVYGDDTAGKTFTMETGTNDDDSAISSHATKPVLTQMAKNYKKRWQLVGITNSTLGTYNMLFKWATAEKPSTWYSQNVDQTAGGKTVNRTVLEPLKYLTGSADATEADKLHDADAGFDSSIVGATVYNTTDGTHTTVSAYVDSGELTLAADIFESGEGYEVWWMPEDPRDHYFLFQCAGSGVADTPWALDEMTVRARVLSSMRR